MLSLQLQAYRVLGAVKYTMMSGHDNVDHGDETGHQGLGPTETSRAVHGARSTGFGVRRHLLLYGKS